MEPASGDPRTRVLYDLAREFAAQLELDQLVPLVVNKCRELIDAEGVSVLQLDRERGELYFPYNSQEDPEVAAKLKGVRFSADRSLLSARGVSDSGTSPTRPSRRHSIAREPLSGGQLAE